MGSLTVLTVGLVISLLVVILFAVTIFGVLVLERTKHNDTILMRLDVLDSLLSGIHGELLNATSMPTEPAPVFRSLDGRFTANSLEELIQKMQADPTSGVQGMDVDGLRKLFENLMGDGFGPDDEDDDIEPWQKGGK